MGAVVLSEVLKMSLLYLGALMKAELPWKSAFNVCIWNAVELFHLCYYLKQQTVYLSAILNTTLKDGSMFLQQNWRVAGDLKST